MAAIGAAAGAYVGMPFLDDGTLCVGAERAVECSLNQVWLPFFTSMTIGMIVAVVITHRVFAIKARAEAGTPDPRRQTERTALEVDDPILQLAAWGAAPHGRDKLEDERREATVSAATEQVQRVHQGPPVQLGRRGRPVGTPRANA